MQSPDGGGHTPKATPKATTHTTPKATTHTTPKATPTVQTKTFAPVAAEIAQMATSLTREIPPVEVGVEIHDPHEAERNLLETLHSWASQVQSDFDLHIINADEAQAQIDIINARLATIGDGIEPVKLELDTEDFIGELESLSSVSISNFKSVIDNLQTLSDMGSSTSKSLGIAADACMLLGSELQQLGQDSAAAKAGMVLAAIGNLVLSYGQAMLSAAKMGWIAWLGFGLTGIAQLTSIITTLNGFASGGIVPGSSTTGDKVVARVNSGEMILNTRQQANLFKLLNNGRVAAPDTYRPKSFDVSFDARRIGDSLYKPGGDFNFTISGRNLVGVLANETRSTSRKSNILI